MQFLLKGIISMIVTLLLQGGVANIVSTTPEDAAKGFFGRAEKQRAAGHGKIHG